MSLHKALQRWQDDPGADAPETVRDNAPEALRDSARLEAVPRMGEEDKEVHQISQSAASQHRKEKRRFWMLILLLLFCVVGLAIGLGAGLGIKRPQGANTAPPQTTPTNTPSSIPLKRGIGNDSSFAAVTQLDGTRHIIFQDISGQLRQAISSSGGNGESWDTSLSNVIATDARPSSPLAAFLRLENGLFNEADTIFLCYVNSSNNIVLLTSQAGQGFTSNYVMNFSGISPFALSQQSRSLSAAATVATATIPTQIREEPNFGVLLMLCDSNEVISLLYGYEALPPGNSTAREQLIWANATSDLQRPATLTNAKFSNFGLAYATSYGEQGPFLTDSLVNAIALTGPPNPSGDKDAVFFTQMLGSNVTTVPNFIGTPFSIPFSNDLTNTITPIYIKPNTSNPTPSSNFTSKMYYIQNGTLNYLNRPGSGALPTNPFPFTNVATTLPSGSASPNVFMYHQINESAFGEEIWNDDTGSWTSTVVRVDTST